MLTKFQNVSYNAHNIFVKDIYKRPNMVASQRTVCYDIITKYFKSIRRKRKIWQRKCWNFGFLHYRNDSQEFATNEEQRVHHRSLGILYKDVEVSRGILSWQSGAGCFLEGGPAPVENTASTMPPARSHLVVAFHRLLSTADRLPWPFLFPRESAETRDSNAPRSRICLWRRRVELSPTY